MEINDLKKESLGSPASVSSAAKSPQPSKVPTPTNRQRRSTGSNRSSKESEDESSSTVVVKQQDQTEEKIKAILEQHKQQQEQSTPPPVGGLLKEAVVPAAHQPPQTQPISVAQTPTATSMIQVQQRPTNLPPRMPAATSTVTSNMSYSQQPQAPQPQPQPQALRAQMPQVVQLPTQPIPPSEIVRTSKQVLLEPKTNKMVSPNKLVQIPSTSPRATSITLPTQPVPMSQSQLNAATCSSIVAKTMAAMLPNQPLPPQSMTMAQPPKLPQHPVPPVVPPTSATSITLVPAPRSASPMKPAQHVALKKREYMSAEIKHEVLQPQQPPPTEQKSIDAYPNPRKGHIKPRDVFGRGEHMLKEEKQPLKVIQPPPPSSPSLPSLEQLFLLRDQEMNMMFQSLVKQGHNEQVAQHLAQQMATERYKSTIDAVLQSQQHQQQQNNERPGSVDYYRGDNNVLFNAPMAHAHARHPNPYVHDPYNRQAAAIATHFHQPPPASPEPTEFSYPSLEAYPVVWQGHLGLKNESASVQFHYISGCKELARHSLPLDAIPHMPTLRIGQRMRLEDAHLSGVRTKMQQSGEHCVLLALPCGKDPQDVEAQSRQLREHFITYLQLKGAAGIVNVPGDYNEGGYVVHVFPSCDFANETMTSIAPDLLARVAEIEHMVIVIATVLDKASSIA